MCLLYKNQFHLPALGYMEASSSESRIIVNNLILTIFNDKIETELCNLVTPNQWMLNIH